MNRYKSIRHITFLYINGATKPVLLNTDDIPHVRVYQWHLVKSGRTSYVCASLYQGFKRHPKRVHMHRLLISAEPSQKVDHLNHNGLDNRRSNLRIVTSQENAFNSQPPVNKISSPFKGVTWHSKSKKWRARIRKNGKLKSLGLYHSQTDAAEAYNKAAIEMFGEYAYINDTKTRSIK